MTARVQDCPAAADGPRPGHARRRARPPSPPLLLRRRRQAAPGRGNLRCGANISSLHCQCEQYEHLLPEQVKEDDLKDPGTSTLTYSETYRGVEGGIWRPGEDCQHAGNAGS